MLNKKGFLSTTMIFTFFILFLLMLVMLLGMYTNNRTNLTELKNDVKDENILTRLGLKGYLIEGSPIVYVNSDVSGIYEVLDDYGTSYVFGGKGSINSNINYNWVKFGKENITTNCTNSGKTKDIMTGEGKKITSEAVCETTYTYSCTNENTIFVGTTSTLVVCTTLGLIVTSGDVAGTYHNVAETIKKDMYWRVVRINGNGNLRMIYSGNFAPKANQTVMAGEWTQIGKSAFNTNDNNNAYIGYMYGDINGTTYKEVHANSNASTIKEYIDYWYENNTDLGSPANDNIVADDYFCYDRSLYHGTYYETNYSSGTGIGISQTAYGAADRVKLYNNTFNPSLICPQANDMYTKISKKVNNKTTVATNSKVGLLSADEAILAGARSSFNKTHYLYSGKSYWLGSPFRFESDPTVLYIGNSFYISTSMSVSYINGVRPVLSVNPKYLTSGDGTASNPWTFSIV